jgi:hypothetical protein
MIPAGKKWGDRKRFVRRGPIGYSAPAATAMIPKARSARLQIRTSSSGPQSPTPL